MVSTKFKNYSSEEYGIKFKNETLLEETFTHSSYVNEHPRGSAGNYGKLEFLGDAVLKLAVSDCLYRHFPSLNKGQLTRLRSGIVRIEGFSGFAARCGFPAEINLGRDEEKTGARKGKTLLEDVFEAFNGALFLDQGMGAVQRFLKLTVYPLIDSGEFTDPRNYRADLQGLLQVDGAIEIEYQVLRETRLPFSFKVALFVEEKEISESSEHNKKAAEQVATKLALIEYREK